MAVPPLENVEGRVPGPKAFAQRLFESFGKEPLLCPKCGDDMMLELIHHPKYGTIKEFSLSEELPRHSLKMFLTRARKLFIL